MHLVTSQTHGRGIDHSSEHHDDSRMDLSDLSSPCTPVRSESGDVASDAFDHGAAWEVANQIGVEIACALTPALDGVRQMQATGRIDRAGLHALVTQLEQARCAGMLGQQIARLAHGGIQQQPEALNLTHALRDALAQRQDELTARGMAVKQLLKPAQVVVDATLLSALLNTLLDWSLRHARTPLDIRLDTKAWPAHARLVCRYGHTPQDQVQASAAESVARSGSPRQRAAMLDCLSWRLLMQLARAMPVHVDRVDTQSDTSVMLEFPHTANDSLEGAASIEWTGGFATSGDAGPPADTQVLVIALRREVLNQIKHSVAQLRLSLDCVGSVADAREFCRRGLPQAIVYESMVYDSAFDSLRNDVKQQCPDLAWIEIVDQGDAFEISSFDGMSLARVGRDAIASSLPSALMFELSKRL
jgi:hypothetical protein